MDTAADIPAELERDPRAAAHEARAERYFKRDLQDQRRWYGERACRFKARAQAARAPSPPATAGRSGAGMATEQAYGRA